MRGIENSAMHHYVGPFLLPLPKQEESLHWLRFIINNEDAAIGIEVCKRDVAKDASEPIVAPSLKETDWQPYHYADPSFPKVSIFDPQTNEVYCLVVIDQKLYRNPFRKIPQRDANNTLIGLNIVPLPFSMAQVYSYQNSHFCSVAKPPVLSHKIEASDYPKWPESLLKRIQFVSVEMFESNKNDVEALNQIIERCGKNIKTDMNPFQVSQVLNAIQWAIVSLWSASESKNEYHNALMHALRGTVDSEASQKELTDSALSNARYLRSKLIPSQINQLGAGDNFYYLAEGASKNITINEVRRYYISLIKKQLPQKLRHQIQITFPENFEVLVGSTIPSADLFLWNPQTLSPEGEQILQNLYSLIVDGSLPEEISLETWKSIDELLTAMISEEYGTHTEFRIIAHTIQVVWLDISQPSILNLRDFCITRIISIFSGKKETPFIEFLPYLSRLLKFYESEPLNQESKKLFNEIITMILNYDYPLELERLEKITDVLGIYLGKFIEFMDMEREDIVVVSENEQTNLVINYIDEFLNLRPSFILDIEMLDYAKQACEILTLSLQQTFESTEQIYWSRYSMKPFPYRAASKGDIQLVKVLLTIDVNIEGMLHPAILNNRIEVIELLLSHDKTAANKPVTRDGYTAFYFALKAGDSIIVDKLLAAGANLIQEEDRLSKAVKLRCEKLMVKKENDISFPRSISKILNDYITMCSGGKPELFTKLPGEKGILINTIKHVKDQIEKLSDDTLDGESSLKKLLAKLCIDLFKEAPSYSSSFLTWVDYCFMIINEHSQKKEFVIEDENHSTNPNHGV